MGSNRHTCKRQGSYRVGQSASLLLLLTGTAFAASFAQADIGGTFSEKLLQSYFNTAGVCTTSSVDSIVESPDHVSVHINIETATAKALVNADEPLRDDWFSLHCPPEIHGIWLQPDPPGDVLISGKVDDETRHTLSCRSYLHLDERQEPVTFKQKILQSVERLLARW